MQKLEQILNAEEAARSRAVSAREQATTVLAEAQSKAQELRQDALLRARAEAEELSESAASAAAAQADLIRQRAQPDLTDQMERARSEFNAVVEDVVAGLVGS